MENIIKFSPNSNNFLEQIKDKHLNNKEFSSWRSKFTNSFDAIKKQHQIAANKALLRLVEGGSNTTFDYVIKNLVQSGADLNAMTEDGKCPIFHLLLKNDMFHYEFFKAFLRAGVDVDIKDCNGDTMLHKLVSENTKLKSDFLSKLFSFPLDVNAQNNEGETPLHLAVKNQCDWFIIGRLLYCGANLEVEDHCGNTPLTYANEELKNKIFNYVYSCEE